MTDVHRAAGPRAALSSPPGPARRRAWLGGAAAGALTLAALVAAASTHEADEGARAIRASDAALAAKNPELAVAEAYLAATHVAPFSPWADRGHARLQAIADDAEARGDDDLAEIAWHAIRSAEVATSGPLSGNPARRRRAELALGRIDARRMLVLAARTPGLARPNEGALAKAHGEDGTPKAAALASLGAGSLLAAVCALALVSGGTRGGRRALAAACGLVVGLAGVAFALVR
ncbi:MAG: hypothetical protein IPF92_02245 [Myxococcales bacterium]|nr:hypothetical protein [Myxococcales bacterium]MBL0193948.1 hypothetical protein [Myxococcales bacterium]HQY63647.1 hypothetical protein [Polyangiaceae bacterium]